MAIKRRLWVLNGVLDEKLDERVLSRVAQKYEKINAYPKDYHYPELYMDLF